LVEINHEHKAHFEKDCTGNHPKNVQIK